MIIASMSVPSPSSAAGWENVLSRNLLLTEALDLVLCEISKPDSVIFGWHYYFGGGRSASLFCFTDFDSYHQELEASRPGDHFTVYSRNAILNQALCRIGAQGSEKTVSFLDIPTELKDALQAGKEIYFLACKTLPTGDRIECKTGVLWELNDEELQNELELGSGCRGEILFFQISKLDEDEAGETITTVSAGSRRRVNALVDGKRPDEAGLTPASGPY